MTPSRLRQQICVVDTPSDEMFVLNKRHVLGICDLLSRVGRNDYPGKVT
jgi:hypothetical protein